MISTTLIYYKEVQIEPLKEHTSTTFLRFEELIHSQVWLQEAGARG
jgi:hypothetical protein